MRKLRIFSIAILALMLILATSTYIQAAPTYSSRIGKFNQTTFLSSTYWYDSFSASNSVGLAFGGGNLFTQVPDSGGTFDSLVKIQESTLAEISRWNSTTFLADTSPIWDGTYIYVVEDKNPSEVVQINPVTMLEVDRWVAPASDYDYLAADGTYVYAARSVANSTIEQITDATMVTNNSLALAPGEYATYVTTRPGVPPADFYVYLAINSKDVLRIDKATLTESDRWTGGAGDQYPIWLKSDGTDLYVSLYGVGFVGRDLLKVTIATMVEADRFVATTNDNGGFRGLDNSGTTLWTTNTSSAGLTALISLDTTTMTEIQRKVNGVAHAGYILYDGISAICAIAAPVPKDLTITSLTSSSVKLNWTRDSVYTTTSIWRRADYQPSYGGATSTEIYLGTAQLFVDSNLTPGTQYYYKAYSMLSTGIPSDEYSIDSMSMSEPMAIVSDVTTPSNWFQVPVCTAYSNIPFIYDIIVRNTTAWGMPLATGCVIFTFGWIIMLSGLVRISTHTNMLALLGLMVFLGVAISAQTLPAFFWALELILGGFTVFIWRRM